MLETLKEPFRRLSRRFKHKRSSKNYASKLRATFNSNYKEHLRRYKRTSKEVEFESASEEQLIKVLSCDSADLNVNDKVQIRQVKTRKIVAEGLVVCRKGQEIRIKLLKPLFFDKSDLTGDKNRFLIQLSTRHIKARKFFNERAIKRFEQVKCSTILHDLILGNYKDARNVRYSRSRLAPANNLPALKGNQLIGAKNSMMTRISLVEGVAGSGKTLVAAHIIHSLCRFKRAKVLFCSPVESSVVRMVQMISKLEHFSVVKIDSKQSAPSPCSLDSLVDQAIYNKTLRCLSRLQIENTAPSEFMEKLQRKSSDTVKNCSNWSRNRMQKSIVKKANVVCCTISNIGESVINNLKFDVLVLDDTHLATEADCFVPLMTKGLKQVILLSEMRHDIRFARLSSMNGMITMESSGDQFTSLRRKCTQNNRNSQRKHAQLGSLSQELGGLFERLLYMGLTTVALNKQFRMHECLSAFPRSQFYLSMSKTDSVVNVELDEKVCYDMECAPGSFDWLPNKQLMTAMFTMKDEASSLEKLGVVLSRLIDSSKIESNRIGIICNRNMSNIAENLGPEFGTVEDFVGQDRDYIILFSASHDGTVTQSNSLEVNFEKSDNSLNIALTRARLGLFIITSCEVDRNCCKSWQELLDYYSKHELIVREDVTYQLIDVEESIQTLNSSSELPKPIEIQSG